MPHVPKRALLHPTYFALVAALALLLTPEAPAAARLSVAPQAQPARTTLIAATASPALPAVPSSLADLRRGLEAQAALQRYFAVGGTYYLETYPAGHSDSVDAWLWSYTQAMAANLSLDDLLGGVEGSMARQDIEHWVVGIDNYWVPANGAYNASVRPPVGINANTYYDDNDWAGLDLLAAYHATGDTHALAQAEAIFDGYIEHGWATWAPCGNLTGGIFWVSTGGAAFQDRTTTATAGAALLGLELYKYTGNQDYLTWGKRMYDWVNQNLRDSGDGLYYDHISPGANGCVVDKDKLTYNQAVMIGATLLLAQVLPLTASTPRQLASQRVAYIDQAEHIAQASLDTFHGGYGTQSAPFNGIFFQTLGELYPYATDNPRLQQSIIDGMRGYTSWAYANVRDPRTGLYWFEPDQGAVFLLDQAAMVQIYATLARCEQQQQPICVMNVACVSSAA